MIIKSIISPIYIVPGKQPCTQLTMLYAGMVNVYDNVPVEKVCSISGVLFVVCIH